MVSEWPQTIQLDGREWELHPDMPVGELTELIQRYQNHNETLIDLMDSMGMDVPQRGIDDRIR